MIGEAAGMEHVYYSANWGTEIADGGTFELGNAILSRESMVERETVFVNGEYNGRLVLGSVPSNILNLQIVKLEGGLTVVNHHGYWDRDPMGNETSGEKMAVVADRLRRVEGGLVFCGDLNLVHGAAAMRHLDFLRDLVYERGVGSTLSGLGYDGEVACDHVLVSGGVGVKDFGVCGEVVSDHLGVWVEL
jgi:endonuclease/exonuclease/phosphatase family metal-dependent hydrolase